MRKTRNKRFYHTLKAVQKLERLFCCLCKINLVQTVSAHTFFRPNETKIRPNKLLYVPKKAASVPPYCLFEITVFDLHSQSKTKMIESLFIGLSTSASCIASCGNIILSIIMAEKKTVAKSFLLLGCFMIGRLLIYSTIAITTSAIGSNVSITPKFTAISLIAVSLLMLTYCIGKTKQFCLNHSFTRKIYKSCNGQSNLIAFAAGVLSSINICPPIISLIASTIGTINIFGSFLLFFIGSSVFFLPMPLIGAIKNTNAVMKIGRCAALLVSVIFLIKGTMIMINS